MQRIICLTAMCLLPVASFVHAGIIVSPYDTVSLPQNLIGSGNGTLDLRLFTFSGSEITNSAGSFNGDNGNNTLPQGGGADTDSFAESYVTTAGELKSYYNLNFPVGSIDEIVLFLDLNETGRGEPNNTLERLDVFLNPTFIQGSPNPSGDVSGSAQAAINQVFEGGTLMANLLSSSNLPVNNQGAGFADYAIFTGINPFSLNDSDVLLFNVGMSTLSSGAEEFFLSGTYSGPDIRPPGSHAPEPATLVIWTTLGGLGLIAARRRKQAA